jgi:radical SAM protein with 4Fe4S-binding SPASM domain
LADGRRRLPLAPDARPVDRGMRPIYAVWELTLRCDLSCTHCGSRAGKPRHDELSTDEALDLVRQLAELEVREVTLIGGEAYLREDWLAIVRAVRDQGMSCTMTTGGRGIDRARARAAAEAGLQSASVSLDGLESTHDTVRGLAGSYAVAIEAMRHLGEAGIAVSVNTQVHRASAAELPALLDVLIAHAVYGWQVALTVPMGRAADDPSILVQPWELHAIYPVLAAQAERAREHGILFFRGNDVGYFGPFEEVFQADQPTDYSCGCGAGREILGIEADGAIKGCPSLATEDWSGGTVRDHKLVDLWERSSALRRLREPRASALWGYCASCYYATDCGAGCTWMADSLFGKPGNNPYCHHRVLDLKRQGLRERVVRVEAPPGVPFDHGRFELVVEPWV